MEKLIPILKQLLLTISALLTLLNPEPKHLGGAVEPKLGAVFTFQAVWKEKFSSPELLQTTVTNHPEIYGNRIQTSPTELLVMKDFQALNNDDALIKIPAIVNEFVLLGVGLQLKSTGTFGSANRIYNFGEVQQELIKRKLIK